MKQEERRELVGQIAADYGVKLDADDPAIIIVDMCKRVLERHIAQLPKASGPGTTPEAVAQAIAAAYSAQVLPRLQAVVATESQKVVARIRPVSLWVHPAFVGVCCALAGVILGFMLRRIA